MTDHQVEIHQPWCKGCNICVALCPKDVLALDNKGKAYVQNLEACIGCQICAKHCPDLAITVDGGGEAPLRGTTRSPHLEGMLGQGPPALLTDKKQPKVLTGNDACALGAMAAGCRFFAGYPITPSSEVAETISTLLPRYGGRFIQMEDEISAMGAVIGASLAGAKALTATSGPGFSLKQENLGYACMTEVPCVVINVMRGGPSTGLPTMGAQQDVMQARWGTHGDHPIIVLCPVTAQECFDLTFRAFNLSETYRVPVILLLDEVVGHTTEKIELPPAATMTIENRPRPEAKTSDFLPYKFTDSDIPPMPVFGEGYRFHVTGLAHDETGFPTNDHVEIDRLHQRLNRKIERYYDEIVRVEEEGIADADLVVIAYGSVARSARPAVRMAREQGLAVGLLRPSVLWPFPEKEIRKACGDKKLVLVPELNLGQFAHEVEWALASKDRVKRLNRVDGNPIPPDQVLDKIKEVLQ